MFGISEQELKLFEISPHASLIAFTFGNEIIIKILNQVDREQKSNTLDYHQSLAFLPIYMDEDYNFQYSKKLYNDKMLTRRKTLPKNVGTSPRKDSEYEDRVVPHSKHGKNLSTKEVLKHLKDFQNLKNYTGSVYVKNKKVIALKPFVRFMMNNPKRIYEMNLRKSTKMKKV